jgi:PAS domain S-box-containing protein
MENDFSGAFDALPGLMWTALPDGHLDFVNRRWREYSGLSVADASRLDWRSVMHAEDLPEFLERWQSLLASGKPSEIEARLRRFDGEYRWLLISINPMRNEDGQLVKWFGLNVDIEDHKRAEEALRQRALDFQLIVDSIPVPVAVTTPTGEVEGLNQMTLKYFGKTFDELKSWKSSEVVHPDDLQHTITAHLEAHLAGGSYNVESRHLRADGTYRWFNVQGFPLRDAEGYILRWFHLLIDIDDRKRAEEGLRTSEINFRKIVDSIPGLVCTLSPAGEFEQFNRQLLEYFGKTPEELKAWADNDAVHPEDLLRVISIFKHSIATGDPYDLECRCRRADGVYRWFHVRALPVRDTDNRITGWYVLLTDIEDRKRAEDALRTNERDLHQIINTIPAAAWSTRPDGYCEFLNQRWLDFTGMTSEDAGGWGWAAAIHPDDAPSLVEYWRAALDAGTEVDVEARMRRFDGQYRWFLFRASPLHDESGKLIKWYGTNTDIEDRKRADGELHRSEAFLAQALNISSTGSFSWRVDTDEIKWSKQLYRIFGIDEGMLLTAERVYSRVHPEDFPLLYEKVEQARRDGLPIEYEHRLLMLDQSIKYVNMVAHATTDASGRLEYFGAVQDVTARRNSEEALSKVRSELAHVARVTSLGALTASIAHEVNQPLSGIVTNASTCLRMLASDPPNVDGALETARRTIRDGNRASEVIARLRALFGKKETTTERVDLNEATREVIALSLSELQRNRVILRQELADDLPLLIGDRVQLQQVILNLLLNASDAMSDVYDRPRQLTVRSENDENDCVRLTIQDVGVGIAPHDLDRLFEAFYTTKSAGMGMGLSISRTIIETHHGRLWVTPNDGPGVTFSFSIPRTSEGLPTSNNPGTIQTPAVTDTAQDMRQS